MMEINQLEFLLWRNQSILTSVQVSPAKDKFLGIRQTCVLDISHVV